VVWGTTVNQSVGKVGRERGARLHRSNHRDGVSDIDAYQ
jgi:hypothetical protein